MTAHIDDSSIPDVLAAREQWICWREDDRDGKPTKVPVKPYPTSGTPFASATDPGTWRDFETALTYHRESSSRTDGVGFVFADGGDIVGVDLDSCRDSDNGELEGWAAGIVDRLDSYTEVSPSGTGVHVLVEGGLPPGRNRRGDVEMYDRDRFFTVTGAHVEGTPRVIARRQDALLAVHHEYVQTADDDATVTVDEATRDSSPGDAGRRDETETSSTEPVQPVGPNSGLRRAFGRDSPRVDDPALEAALHGLSPDELPDPIPRTVADVAGPGVDLTDDELVKRATASKSGDTIRALLAGDDSLWTSRASRYPSQSEADMGLCFFLGFWTGGDPDRMDRLFRASGLMRAKWDRRHYGNGATYGSVCIARTLLKLDDYYSPPAARSESTSRSSRTSSSRSETGSRVDIGQGDGPVSEDGPDVPGSDTSEREASRIDVGAVEDATRLAAKVNRQQRQLAAYEERIAELETQVRWYQIALELLSEESGGSAVDDLPDDWGDLESVEPSGEPAAPPEGELDDSESTSVESICPANPDSSTAHGRVREHTGVESTSASSTPVEDDESGSTIRAWFRRRWS